MINQGVKKMDARDITNTEQLRGMSDSELRQALLYDPSIWSTDETDRVVRFALYDEIGRRRAERVNGN